MKCYKSLLPKGVRILLQIFQSPVLKHQVVAWVFFYVRVRISCIITVIHIFIIGCLKKPSKRPLFLSCKHHISQNVTNLKSTQCKLSNGGKNFQSNTYLCNGQNDISTGFPFWPRYYMFILKLTEYYLAVFPSTWLP